MYFKLLACDVLLREIAHCIARCPHTISPAFMPKGEHVVPARLRETLQKQIDSVESDGVAYDAVLLGYGLCGNSTAGLVARSFPLVIPRAHDCTTLFLGSKAAFCEHFSANPSQGWTSIGYSERGGGLVADGTTSGLSDSDGDFHSMVELYGEESARYLWETMHPEKHYHDIIFIDVPETREPRIEERLREEAARLGKPIRELPGSLRLIEGLLAGNWNSEEFLVIPPGQRVVGVYDQDEIMAAERPAE